MARYRGTVQGNRTQASRLGHATTGLKTTANGWDLGVTVHVYPSPGHGPDADRVEIWLTAGSHRDTLDKLIGTYTRADLDAMNA